MRLGAEEIRERRKPLGGQGGVRFEIETARSKRLQAPQRPEPRVLRVHLRAANAAIVHGNHAGEPRLRLSSFALGAPSVLSIRSLLLTTGEPLQ